MAEATPAGSSPVEATPIGATPIEDAHTEERYSDASPMEEEPEEAMSDDATPMEEDPMDGSRATNVQDEQPQPEDNVVERQIGGKVFKLGRYLSQKNERR